MNSTIKPSPMSGTRRGRKVVYNETPKQVWTRRLVQLALLAAIIVGMWLALVGVI